MIERPASRRRHLPSEILTEEEVHALLRTCSDTLSITVSLHLGAPNRRGTRWVKYAKDALRVGFDRAIPARIFSSVDL